MQLPSLCGAIRISARCLIPAAGWYEWSPTERTDPDSGEIEAYKQPHFIYRADRRLIAFAGLMSLWHLSTEASVLTCAILTRSAAPAVADVHDRMPAVLQEADFARWLDPNVTKPNEVASVIEAEQSDFAHYPVSTRLNAAKNNDEELAKPLQMSA
jgi:putative SOS response-associated peptidase YedK